MPKNLRSSRRVAFLALGLAFAGRTAPAQEPELVSNGLAGYISMEVPAPPPEFGYGVSLYATAWPLVERPLRDFQIGLASIWIVPENRAVEEPLVPHGTVARDQWPERGPSYRDVFQTIEGGLGFWASTRFGATTAKFRMNGTPDGYNHEISSPGFGFGVTTALAKDEMGIAQLSPSLLVPPDGLTFERGTCGELFGYAWMVLPLVAPKTTTAGLPIPTGGQCWTLFVRSRDFNGPVAFYTPTTWSRISRRHPPAVARGLDARPGLVTGGAIEINTVPRFVGRAADGATYTRIPRLQFPADRDGRTVLLHQLTHYSKAALYDEVAAWIAGGKPPSGRFDPRGAVTPECKAEPLAVSQGEPHQPIRGCERWVATRAFDAHTFGLQWQPTALAPWTDSVRRASFPEYFRRDAKELVAVAPADVPESTGLARARFADATDDATYAAPEAASDHDHDRANDVWHRPGPRAGPFTVKLADGSVVTYFWYRFIDQPALQDADLDPAEKQRLQALVEQLLEHWTPERDYLPPPAFGTIAALDPALIVHPPPNLERGCVPIVVRQSAK